MGYTWDRIKWYWKNIRSYFDSMIEEKHLILIGTKDIYNLDMELWIGV